MTDALLPDRDRAAIDALVADRYLDGLLAAGDRRADDAPADASLDPELRHAALVLRRSLVRLHPSFRFEERLADRLATLAVATGGAERQATAVLALPVAGAGPIGTGPSGAGPVLDADPLLGAILGGDLDPASDDIAELDGPLAAARRPLLVGGAITSAAISLVGVAWVAWRATRPSGRGAAVGVMTRAARAARARRQGVDLPDLIRGLS